MGVIKFGSPEAQNIVELNRAMRVLDRKLRAYPTEDCPYVFGANVQDAIHILEGDVGRGNLYHRAWNHMLKTKLWRRYWVGDDPSADRYQPNDDEDAP